MLVSFTKIGFMNKTIVNNFETSSSMDVYAESSGIDTSPDMNSSVETLQTPPERCTVMPRKLTFLSSPEIDQLKGMAQPVGIGDTCGGGLTDFKTKLIFSPKKQSSISPPYRRVRELKLQDSPSTPKTILKISENNNNIIPSYSENIAILAKSLNSTYTKSLNSFSSTPAGPDKPRAIHIHNRQIDVVQQANINPFSPNNLLLCGRKRQRGYDFPKMFNSTFNNDSFLNIRSNDENDRGNSSNSMLCSQDVSVLLDDEPNDVKQAPKRLALQDTNISRYSKEFYEISLIGCGEFGQVYQCLNRLDGCVYAIKRSKKPVAGSKLEKTALNEVWAHAVLGKHDNVVRYYSAWSEDSHMLIQNEFCNGGSLQTLLQRQNCLTEPDLKTLLLHIAEGLKYIHSNNLVHMDIKSGNIFLSKSMIKVNEHCDDGFDEVCEEIEHEVVTYKIGDLGHVTSVTDPKVEEGDCRYLPKEILNDDYTNLTKADIFSLGITIYEAAGGGPLPKNGDEWHKLRMGMVPYLPNISREFNDLIKLMTHPIPSKRPSAVSIFDHPVLCPSDLKSKAQLNHELSIERQRCETLRKKLRDTRKILKSYELSRTPIGKKGKTSPILSDRKLRSYSRKKQRTNASISRRNLRDRNRNIIDDRDL